MPWASSADALRVTFASAGSGPWEPISGTRPTPGTFRYGSMEFTNGIAVTSGIVITTMSALVLVTSAPRAVW